MPSDKNILLVEDDPVYAAAEALTLKNNGFNVVTASTGETAIQLFNSECIDIVLMDINLGPGINGSETAAVILQKKNIPIVFLTAHTEEDYVKKVNAIPHYGYVLKNSGMPALLAAIEKAFKDFTFIESLKESITGLKAENEELLEQNLRLRQNETDLKLSEANLKESEDRYRQLFEGESDAILLIDNEYGNLLEANNAAAILYGYSREELLTMKNTDLSAEPEETQKITLGTPVISDNVVTIPLRYHKRKDGIVFPVEITGRFFQWHGRPVHIAAIRNITTRISDQNALKEKSNELELFFTVALDLFCIADTDGNFIRVNKSWEKILGYNSAELERMKFLDFVHPDDMKSTMKAVKTLTENNPVLNFVNRYRCKDGSYRFLEWQSYPYGKLIYAAARDITGRKQNEDKIQSLLQEKEMLLREVHHRIKNNMYTISNLLFLQSETLSDRSAVDALNDARSRVQSMMLIYDKLYRSTDYKNISIKEYLSSLIDDISSIFPGSKIITVEKHIEDFIMSSDTLFNIGIIINELVTNSFKYAFPDQMKGTIKISAFKADDNNAEISVSDNGIGFKSSKGENANEGFGLELIRILAEQMDAAMSISGENGTTFKMRFIL